MTLASLLGSPIVQSADWSSSDLDLVCEQILRCTRMDRILEPHQIIEDACVDQFLEAAGRCANGEPLAYVLGWTYFDGLLLEVTPDVLIPRPDTETLVHATLGVIESERASVLDVCTGTGAVALSLKARSSALNVEASDISEAAIALAETNARRLKLSIHWRVADLLEEASHYDVVCANPPYIARDDGRVERSVAHHEPPLALYANGRGLAIIEALINEAQAHLNPGGWLVLEHGLDQGESVRRLAVEAGWQRIDTWNDLAGRERVTRMRTPHE